MFSETSPNGRRGVSCISKRSNRKKSLAWQHGVSCKSFEIPGLNVDVGHTLEKDSA